MSHLLYIKASPRGDRSYSGTVADAFVEAYSRAHPDDQVRTFDVFYDDLPAFDFEAAAAKYKIMHGKDHTEQEKQTWERIVSVIEEFKAADKYVLAVPMWTFAIPYRLKQFFDVIVQPGQTFAVTEDGRYEGLVKGRPAVIVYSRGGEYPPDSEAQAFDFQTQYTELILNFMGITEIQSVVIEPTLLKGPEAAARAKLQAVDKARELAKTF